MQNKFFRFFSLEPQFRFKAVIFLIFFIIIPVEFRVFQQKEHQLAKIKSEKALVMRIGEMERAIQVNTVHAQLSGKSSQVTVVKYNLTGTSITGDISYAIIDGLIYTEGDTIGEYTVMKIAKDSVTLESKSANKIKNLSWPGK